MRSDYGLYIVAVMCFIIAGVSSVLLSETLQLAAIAIFFILGIISAAAGYNMRPKIAAPTPTAPPPLPAAEPSPPTPQPTPLAEEKIEEAPIAPLAAAEEIHATPSPPAEPVPEPTTPVPEEPAKVEAAEEKPEEKLEEKPVRRRRRKKTE